MRRQCRVTSTLLATAVLKAASAGANMRMYHQSEADRFLRRGQCDVTDYWHRLMSSRKSVTRTTEHNFRGGAVGVWY